MREGPSSKPGLIQHVAVVITCRCLVTGLSALSSVDATVLPTPEFDVYCDKVPPMWLCVWAQWYACVYSMLRYAMADCQAWFASP